MHIKHIKSSWVSIDSDGVWSLKSAFLTSFLERYTLTLEHGRPTHVVVQPRPCPETPNTEPLSPPQLYWRYKFSSTNPWGKYMWNLKNAPYMGRLPQSLFVYSFLVQGGYFCYSKKNPQTLLVTVLGRILAGLWLCSLWFCLHCHQPRGLCARTRFDNKETRVPAPVFLCLFL